MKKSKTRKNVCRVISMRSGKSIPILTTGSHLNGPDRMSIVVNELLIQKGLPLEVVRAVAGENLLRLFSEL